MMKIKESIISQNTNCKMQSRFKKYNSIGFVSGNLHLSNNQQNSYRWHYTIKAPAFPYKTELLVRNLKPYMQFTRYVYICITLLQPNQ